MANGIHQWRTHQAMHRSFRQQPYVAWHPSSSSAALGRPSVLARVAQGGTKAKETLHTLDALLGQTVPSHSPSQVQDDSDDEHEWWTLQPKQSAPPRQVTTSPGTGTGRFILNEDLLQLAEMRVGSKTSLDGQLELPKVQPVISFVLLLLNLSVYSTYLKVATLQGPDAAMDFLSGLWMQPILLLHDPPFIQVMHAMTASVMAPGPVELVVTLWALAMVAPRAESVMGYIPFISIYMLSGVTGTLAQLFSMADGRYSPDSLGACGASAAIMGVLGCLAVHHLVNREVEAEAAGWRDTSSISSSRHKSARRTSSLRLRAPSPEPPTYHTPSPSPRPSSPDPFSSLRESDREPSPGISYREQSPDHTPPTPTTSSSTPTRQQAGQRLLLVQSVCVAAVSLGLAGMQMLQGHPSDAGGGAGLWGEVAVGVGVLPQMAGLGAGVLLGLGMGPQYALQREVDIPEGSMVVPEDAEEMVVVLDRRTNWQQITTGVMYSGALVVMLLSAGNA